ncbi:MAG: hypothetical protein NTU90_05635 [Proteobacteria bacterium]|nr:hypothetical protein [Pseudomonadota bacterium]
MTCIFQNVNFGSSGRVLVRYSGTQNICSIMVEGLSDNLTEKYCEYIASVLKSVLGWLHHSNKSCIVTIDSIPFYERKSLKIRHLSEKDQT